MIMMKIDEAKLSMYLFIYTSIIIISFFLILSIYASITQAEHEKDELTKEIKAFNDSKYFIGSHYNLTTKKYLENPIFTIKQEIIEKYNKTTIKSLIINDSGIFYRNGNISWKCGGNDATN